MLKNLPKNTRFAMVFLLISMVAAFVVLVMLLTLNIQAGAGAMAFVIPLGAGMFAGQWEYQEQGKMPEGSFLWTEAVRYAAIGLAMFVAMCAIMFMSPQNLAALQEIGIPTIAGALIVLYAVNLLAIRLGLGIGLKSERNKS